MAPLDPIFVFLSWLGAFGQVWLVLGLVAALFTRRPVLLLQVGLALLASHVAAAGLKAAVDRRRPPEQLPDIDPLVALPASGSFPSGHAATGFAAALVLSFALPRWAVAFFALASAIAFSHLYTGVHFPSDVLAGAVLGALVATALLLLARVRPGSRSWPTRDRPRDRRRGSRYPRTRRGSR